MADHNARISHASAVYSTKPSLLSLQPIHCQYNDENTNPLDRPPSSSSRSDTDPHTDALLPDPHALANTCSHSIYGGPLSSHPVTPSESPVETSYFPTMKFSMPSKANGTKPQPPAANGSTDSLATDAHNNGNAEQPRHGSFAKRLLRLRSISSLRSFASSRLNESDSSLARSSTTNLRNEFKDATAQTVTSSPANAVDNPQPRGTKRPADTVLHAPPGHGSLRSSMRRKSMDLLSTARRASGLWSRSDLSSADASKGASGESQKQSTPSLPQIQAIDVQMDREGWFDSIGR